ncbi:hypothetical protein D3C79_1045810 [compost metagenome]
MLGDLFIALTRKRRPQIVKPFEIVSMQYVPSRPGDALYKLLIALTWRNHIAAAYRRYLDRKSQGVSNLLIHRNPPRCQSAGATAFGAILNVNPP